MQLFCAHTHTRTPEHIAGAHNDDCVILSGELLLLLLNSDSIVRAGRHATQMHPVRLLISSFDIVDDAGTHALRSDSTHN